MGCYILIGKKKYTKSCVTVQSGLPGVPKYNYTLARPAHTPCIDKHYIDKAKQTRQGELCVYSESWVRNCGKANPQGPGAPVWAQGGRLVSLLDVGKCMRHFLRLPEAIGGHGHPVRWFTCHAVVIIILHDALNIHVWQENLNFLPVQTGNFITPRFIPWL